MNRRRKQALFWGRAYLEVLAYIAGVSLCMFAITDVGSREYVWNGGKSLAAELAARYTAYVLMVGLFFVVIYSISYFSMGFHVLLSMNATRTSIVNGIMCMLGGTMLTIQAFAGMMWRLLGGETSSKGLMALPFLSGGMFALTAVFVVGNLVVLKWGQRGGIIMGLMCALLGGCAGMSFVLLKDGWGLQKLNMDIVQRYAGLFLALGIFLFICVWFLALRATRKAQVIR